MNFTDIDQFYHNFLVVSLALLLLPSSAQFQLSEVEAEMVFIVAISNHPPTHPTTHPTTLPPTWQTTRECIKMALDNQLQERKVASLYEFILKTIWTLPFDPKSGMLVQKTILDVVKKIISEDILCHFLWCQDNHLNLIMNSVQG